MEDNDAINIVIINPCKETCRCRPIIFLHPCPQVLPGAGRDRGLSWGWVVCLIVNTNPRYTQHVQITGVPRPCLCFRHKHVQIIGDPASAFVLSTKAVVVSRTKLRCNTFGYFALAILEDTIAFVLCLI